ncbi:hypothetical protein J7M02_02310 [Candidatus Aerophobetes bacterium]|nr:hypothetical protein [Candidatus Aerophobetes bacterium]
MTTRRLTRSQVLQITNVTENSFDYFIRIGVIPHPNKILWLNPPSDDEEYFPEYVIFDLFHLNYLQRLGIYAPWELRKFVFGNEGTVKYEADMRNSCGDTFCNEVHSNEGEASEKLCKLAEDHLQSYKIVAATFRAEKVGSKVFLILSRVVLKPIEGFFQVEVKQSYSKDSDKKLAQTYTVILRGTLS